MAIPLVLGPGPNPVTNVLAQMGAQRPPSFGASFLAGQQMAEKRKQNALQQQLQALQTQALFGRLGLDSAKMQAELAQRAGVGNALAGAFGPGYEAFGDNPSAAASVYRAMNPELFRQPGTNVNVSTGGIESAEQAAQKAAIEARYKAAGERNQSLIGAGETARRQIGQMEHALRLLESGAAETGFGTPQRRALMRGAVALGLGDEAELANLESLAPVFGQTLFNSISQTKGAVSEKEMDIFAQLGPGYQNSTRGNIKLLRYGAAKARRDMMIADKVEDMLQDPTISPLEINWRVREIEQQNDLTETLFDRVGTVRGRRVGYIELPEGGAATFELRDGDVRFIGNVPGVR